MKTVQALVVSTALAIGMATPASAGVNDPEVIIYRFPGVQDDGSANFAGVATKFLCTNFSGLAESMRFATRDQDGTLLSNQTAPINHLQSVTAVTHGVNSSNGNQKLLLTTIVREGTTAIAATSTSIICTAAVVDAAATKPQGLALRGIRFNPVPGSQE